MNPLQSQAAEFRRRFHLNPGLSQTSLSLQATLISEEAQEVAEAVADLQQNLHSRSAKAHLLKEVGDLVYVCFQLAEAFGWDLTEACNQIHSSNLSKLGPDGEPIRREDGKILKGPFYLEPYINYLV
jgi:NTP pyrophosphatase (non-canonical NTP hydrolase)